jgi:hypothetical protein
VPQIVIQFGRAPRCPGDIRFGVIVDANLEYGNGTPGESTAPWPTTGSIDQHHVDLTSAVREKRAFGVLKGTLWSKTETLDGHDVYRAS